MIDTSTWKEFNMSDIGFKNFHGIRQKQSDRTEGNTPLLTAGKENQGVASYIGNPPSTYIDSITVDMFGNSFFHKGVYAGDDNIYFFVNDNVSDEAKLFIAAIINTDNTSKYAFKDQFRQPQADALSVHLPATSDGQPDWDYMESYMKAVMEESEKSLENLKKADDTKHLIDVNEWGEFKVSDLFDVKNSKSISDKRGLDFDDSNPYDFIGRTPINNGIQGKINKQDFEPNDENTFSVTQIGEKLCLFRENKWYACQNIFILTPLYSELIDVRFYICCMVTKTLKVVFGEDAYSSYPTKDTLSDMVIKLPITSTGEPDWQYMEDYMRNIMDKSEQIISDLQIGA